MGQKTQNEILVTTQISNFLYTLQTKGIVATKNSVNLFLKENKLPLSVNFGSTGFYYERRVVPLIKQEREYDCSIKRQEILNKIKITPKECIFSLEEYGYQNYRDKKMYVITRRSLIQYSERFELGRESKLSNKVMIVGLDGFKFETLHVKGEYYTFDQMKEWFVKKVIPQIISRKKQFQGKRFILLDEYFQLCFNNMIELQNYNIELIVLNHSESRKLNPLTLALNDYELDYSELKEEVLDMVCTKCGLLESNFIRSLSKTNESPRIEDKEKTCKKFINELTSTNINEKINNGYTKINMQKNFNDNFLLTQRIVEEENTFSDISSWSENDESIIEIPTLTKIERKKEVEYILDEEFYESNSLNELVDENETYSEEFDSSIKKKEYITKNFYLQLTKEQKKIYHWYVKRYSEKEPMVLKLLERNIQQEIKKEIQRKEFKIINNSFEQFIFLYLRHPYDIEEIDKIFHNRFMVLESSLIFTPKEKLNQFIFQLQNVERVYGFLSINQIHSIAQKYGIFFNYNLVNELNVFGWREIVDPNIIFYHDLKNYNIEKIGDEYKKSFIEKCKEVPKSFIFCIGNFGGILDLYKSPRLIVNKSLHLEDFVNELKEHPTHMERQYPVLFHEGMLLSNVMGCICADGTSMNPLLVCSSPSQEEEYLDKENEHIFIGTIKNTYCDINNFKEWFKEIIIKEINKKKSIKKYFSKVIFIANEHLKEYFEDKEIESYINMNKIEIMYNKQEINYYWNPIDTFIHLMINDAFERRINQRIIGTISDYRKTKMSWIIKANMNSNIIRQSFQSVGVKNTFDKDEIEFMSKEEQIEFNSSKEKELHQPIQIQLRKQKFSFEIKYTKPLYRTILSCILKNIEWNMLDNKYDLYDYFLNNYPFFKNTNFDQFLEYQKPKQLSYEQINQFMNKSKWDEIDTEEDTIEIYEPSPNLKIQQIFELDVDGME
ncbi:hypothetical protein EHI8A_090310 [Entamoeba histolytica HM-1:IMSS-B]|uniref:Uncharacterized protein n=6 Tax=Entamoeba histolytica TaxID=5759 RepID=C4M3N0_ENTH1|nr:hypothetical protein EHI_140580 [Entamoeba histolytica HM-1:IMSS]EMD46052.1 Hypothetical protein EHI5A_124800 [Entamoeba histolytica KU27]EMH78306.1 hypothetical protein EHI8A_090310 [Entamoeba histolytica HM-1:IMSS-B]EMS16735.1 hypothetical protein KM1_158350 [Entamoeba histolytica HM-3:IMSS]ENY64985.1 hypothetical protein EHI7A_087800 [Entamoeba histolytica HM-1:IMSS-A]GAT95932.1 hypothetical protein CL6EHI_140580 [Entamoeba histolytica]|eukprot:XP_654186.2 hypothetical protein EHI_140580 [Entamoeba histolytica HM-1:IMSS]